MDRLVVTKFPFCGPLAAVILAGPVPAVSSSRLAGSIVSAVWIIGQALEPVVRPGAKRRID